MKLGVQAVHEVEMECVMFGCYSLKTKDFINMFMGLIFLGSPCTSFNFSFSCAPKGCVFFFCHNRKKQSDTYAQSQ